MSINATEMLGNLCHALSEAYPGCVDVLRQCGGCTAVAASELEPSIVDYIEGMHEYPGQGLIRALELNAYTDDGVIVLDDGSDDDDDDAAMEIKQETARSAFLLEFKGFIDRLLGALRLISDEEIKSGYVPRMPGCYRGYVMGEWGEV